ncbi:Co2+/Mg2+ efflux protein ApaG [Nitratireductor sp. CH_MIT9313-5]|jgi:ApaG protein|uniref:Co2+/Mg2+ efflux protein ApaG n=1 Tax=Nitratireductor sp. CH_MIT9313-5 TaxID=3107764 RepID=UPI00300B664B
MYKATTREIEVRVRPFFLPEQSDPDEGRFVWAYHICIINHGETTVQLLARYWHITDGLGRVQEVEGEGVVGEKPVLKPGESYEYTSGCPLNADSGIMVGRYTMREAGGDFFEVDIPAFSLDIPGSEAQLN